MKKTGFITCSLIMSLALVIAIVGFSAAWFGEVKRLDRTVVINSYAPVGNATVSATSTSDYAGSTALRPARILPSLVQNDGAGAGLYDALDVLDASLVGDTLEYVATQVTISFDFQYGGTADYGQNNKAIEIDLTSATLSNPRTDGYVSVSTYATEHGIEIAQINTALRYSYNATNGLYTQDNTGLFVKVTNVNTNLVDYKREFNYAMSVGLYTRTTVYDSTKDYYVYENSKYSKFEGELDAATVLAGEYYVISPVSGQTEDDDWYSVQKDNTLCIIAVPYTTAVFSVTINFAKIDEETAPSLMNAEIFFNFQIDAMNRNDI